MEEASFKFLRRLTTQNQKGKTETLNNSILIRHTIYIPIIYNTHMSVLDVL